MVSKSLNALSRYFLLPHFPNRLLSAAFIMHLICTWLVLFATASITNANAFPNFKPGFDDYYSDYRGKATPYPGNEREPILATGHGNPGPDDILFQNLLAAEWAIFSFYQQAVEMFDEQSFTALGLPSTTYDRIQEIRANEAGHLILFRDHISGNSVKPGACNYRFGFTDVKSFIGTMTLLEIASMAFLSALVQQANTNATRGALVAIASTESRHETWALMDLWGANPLGGPTDTAFPYANQILYTTNRFVVPGSCPSANPPYPYPAQEIAQFTYDPRTESPLTSGSEIKYVFLTPPPPWEEGKNYYAVFFHGLERSSVLFDAQKNTTDIPDFDLNKGLIICVIADTPDAPYKESVVAGPVLLVQQPAGALKMHG
jgi:hypothetical protein